MTKRISLAQGKFALVDDEDYEWLNQWPWFCGSRGYVISPPWPRNSKGWLKMHRLIVCAPVGSDVDHMNCNKLDNRRCNLRVCSRSQNMSNNEKCAKPKSSRFKGVSWRKDLKKWRARLDFNGEQVNLGIFDSEIKAARAYNAAARKYHGEFARLNEMLNWPENAAEAFAILAPTTEATP